MNSTMFENVSFLDVRICTVLTTVLQKFSKNPTKILIAWCFKLANRVAFCDKIESGSLSPSENLSHCLTQ